jgi:hypothetical protein
LPHEIAAAIGAGDHSRLMATYTGCRATVCRRPELPIADKGVVAAPTEAVGITGSDIRRLAEEIPTLQDVLRSAAAERRRRESS